MTDSAHGVLDFEERSLDKARAGTTVHITGETAEDLVLSRCIDLRIARSTYMVESCNSYRRTVLQDKLSLGSIRSADMQDSEDSTPHKVVQSGTALCRRGECQAQSVTTAGWDAQVTSPSPLRSCNKEAAIEDRQSRSSADLYCISHDNHHCIMPPACRFLASMAVSTKPSPAARPTPTRPLQDTYLSARARRYTCVLRLAHTLLPPRCRLTEALQNVQTWAK